MAQLVLNGAQFKRLSRKLKQPAQQPAKKAKIKPPPLCDFYRVVCEPVTITLPLSPLLNRYYRTRVCSGHSMTYISKEGNDFRELVIAQWRKQAGPVTFEGRLAMVVEVVYRDDRSDLDGRIKALWDALEHAGAYRNDKQIRRLIINQDRIEPPGKMIVTVGPKPLLMIQRDLFSMECF